MSRICVLQHWRSGISGFSAWSAILAVHACDKDLHTSTSVGGAMNNTLLYHLLHTAPALLSCQSGHFVWHQPMRPWLINDCVLVWLGRQKWFTTGSRQTPTSLLCLLGRTHNRNHFDVMRTIQELSGQCNAHSDHLHSIWMHLLCFLDIDASSCNLSSSHQPIFRTRCR